MDPNWIVFAFILGYLARQIKLPPLVGYLLAGFLLNEFGVRGGSFLQLVSDFGVQLLLFSIGLKLRLKNLARPEVWGGATIHMIVVVLLFGAIFLGIGKMGFAYFRDLSFLTSLLLAFALSFSSTVFAVKIFEEKGEMISIHARTAVGILIMQDIFAVVFLAFSKNEIPSIWFLGVIPLLFILKPILLRILVRVGHGELLILYGFLVCFGGAALFEAVKMKPDLGALAFGILISSHPRASELSKALFSIKDLFLVGFFLNIGLESEPNWGTLTHVLMIVGLLCLKGPLYFFFMTRFGLRPRTSFLTSISLSNYSEFGLIVAVVGAANGWIASEWLFIIAMALSISFVLASWANEHSHMIYSRQKKWLDYFHPKREHPEDKLTDCKGTEIVIFGMGRIGTKVYDTLKQRYPNKLAGVDQDQVLIKKHIEQGRNVLHGDAADPNFWERSLCSQNFKLIVLALPHYNANKIALKQLKESGYQGPVAALAHYEDEEKELQELGVSAIFNPYTEAGNAYGLFVSNQIPRT